jgi:EpsI family protein
MTTIAPETPMQDAPTLAALRPRTLVLLVILLPAIVLTGVLVAAERRSMRSADVAEKAIPATILAKDRVWTSIPMTFTETEMEILETRDYMFRSYSDGKGPSVDMCVVFSEDNRKGTHPPDVCLEASGYRTMSRSDRVVMVDGTALTLRELVTTGEGGGGRGGAGEQYMYFAYFYKCGDLFTPSFYQQQVEIIWNGLTRRNAAGALIRFSTPMSGYADLAGARSRTDALLAAAFPYLKKNLNATE